MTITPGFLFGMIIGIALGLLLAPQPGEETREQLSERSRGMRERARQYWEQS